MKSKSTVISILIFTAALVIACSAIPATSTITQPVYLQPTAAPAISVPAGPVTALPSQPAATQSLPSGSSTDALAALQSTLETIYANVNPSVVNIQVTSGSQTARAQQVLGSGFVFDSKGNIVTNNHVVAGADTVTVTFSDGRVLTAKVVGTDPDADLAVINVANAGQLTPLQLTDSDQVKVGQMAVAIGNPFGLSGTMTVGFVSALGRSIADTEVQTANGPGYTIPDVIQTDAAINPGNSGGVLVNDQGQVMGVTAAIESSTGSNAGIGFVIPANIVTRVVPELIKNGKMDHPYLGVSGTNLTPQLAKAMNLSESQRGALIITLGSGGPSDKAGIKGSNKTVQIGGLDAQVGGDVIVAIGGQKINTFDDLVSYIFKNGVIGQSVKVDILRDGSSQSINVVLAARPATTTAVSQQPGAQNPAPRLRTPRLALGLSGIMLDPTIAQAMNLKQDQQGVLVEQIQSGSPAEQAGLKASDKAFDDQGQQMMIGGDIITAANGSPVTSVRDLRNAVVNVNPGDTVKLSILRDGQEMTVNLTLPAN